MAAAAKQERARARPNRQDDCEHRRSAGGFKKLFKHGPNSGEREARGDESRHGDRDPWNRAPRGRPRHIDEGGLYRVGLAHFRGAVR